MRTLSLIKVVYFSIGVFDWLLINNYEYFPTNGVDKSKRTFILSHPPLLCKLCLQEHPGYTLREYFERRYIMQC